MKKICVFLYSCILLCVFFNLNLTAQNHSFSSYKDKTNTLVSNYQNALIQKALWRPFENKVEDLIKDMDDDLTQGSGLSFDEMNSVRNYKSLLQATTVQL